MDVSLWVSDCVRMYRLMDLYDIGSLLTNKTCYIVCYWWWMSEFMVSEYVSRFGLKRKMVLGNNAVKTEFLGLNVVGTGSPVGEPGFQLLKWWKMVFLNSGTGSCVGGTGFPIDFSRGMKILLLGTGSLPGGTGFPIHFSRGVVFWNCGNRLLPGRNRVPLFLFENF